MSARGTKGRGYPAVLAVCLLAVALLAACQPGPGTSQRTTAGRGASASGGPVVVASFNFPESELIAAIYGLAIRHAGIPVQLRLDLGPRELVQPALEQGLVDFPSWREGRVVLLCWQFGERQLAYWHGEDEGFAGRKPLEGGTPQPVNVLN